MKFLNQNHYFSLAFSLLKFHSTKEQHSGIKYSINPIDTSRYEYRYLSIKNILMIRSAEFDKDFL